MEQPLDKVRDNLIHACGRIGTFWGFSKVMGQLYGLLYLTPEPLTLDAMRDLLGVSKGNVSLNVRQLERIGMVKRYWRRGDRKDYYEAEIDFWKIIKNIMKEREKKEFDQALQNVAESLALIEAHRAQLPQREAEFTVARLEHMREFFDLLDTLVFSVLSLDRPVAAVSPAAESNGAPDLIPVSGTEPPDAI